MRTSLSKFWGDLFISSIVSLILDVAASDETTIPSGSQWSEIREIRISLIIFTHQRLMHLPPYSSSLFMISTFQKSVRKRVLGKEKTRSSLSVWRSSERIPQRKVSAYFYMKISTLKITVCTKSEISSFCVLWWSASWKIRRFQKVMIETSQHGLRSGLFHHQDMLALTFFLHQQRDLVELLVIMIVG